MTKTKIKASLRNEVLRRDGFTCLWCKKSIADGVKLHTDHVIPEAFGGNTTYENLGTLCEECNTSKGSEYFGDYLLTTLYKLKDLDTHITEEDYGKNFRCSLKFYIWVEQGEGFYPHTLSQVESLPNSFMPLQGDTMVIRKSEMKRDARRVLKSKIRDFLFENKGFIEELDGKLIFRKR